MTNKERFKLRIELTRENMKKAEKEGDTEMYMYYYGQLKGMKSTLSTLGVNIED